MEFEPGTLGWIFTVELFSTNPNQQSTQVCLGSALPDCGQFKGYNRPKPIDGRLP